MTRTKNVFYYNIKEDNVCNKIAHTLSSLLEFYNYTCKDIVVLCIGSDRVTGDSLGPLIGYKLEKFSFSHNIFFKKHTTKKMHLYGTLDNPVHAMNLSEKIEIIKKKHPESPIIAIDASLGNTKYIGFITVGAGPLHPGTGVHKELPAVGDFFITGIVGTSGVFEHMTLQTTRLSTVMHLADTITQGLVILFSSRSHQ